MGRGRFPLQSGDSFLLEAKASLSISTSEYVQKQLGHESLESTAIYTHVAIEPLREMFKKYHPREISLKKSHKIPSPENIISDLEEEEG